MSWGEIEKTGPGNATLTREAHTEGALPKRLLLPPPALLRVHVCVHTCVHLCVCHTCPAPPSPGQDTAWRPGQGGLSSQCHPPPHQDIPGPSLLLNSKAPQDNRLSPHRHFSSTEPSLAVTSIWTITCACHPCFQPPPLPAPCYQPSPSPLLPVPCLQLLASSPPSF